jgi:hypothetical protein
MGRSCGLVYYDHTTMHTIESAAALIMIGRLGNCGELVFRPAGRGSADAVGCQLKSRWQQQR